MNVMLSSFGYPFQTKKRHSGDRSRTCYAKSGVGRQGAYCFHAKVCVVAEEYTPRFSVNVVHCCVPDVSISKDNSTCLVD